MNTRARSVGRAAVRTLLVCAVTFTVHGCGGTKPSREQAIELRQTVPNNVPEAPRRAQMLSIVDRLEALQLRFSQDTADFVASFRKLNADYDSTRPAFDQLFSDYRAKRIKARGEALDLHFQLASLAVGSEWNTGAALGGAFLAQSVCGLSSKAHGGDIDSVSPMIPR